MRNKTFLSWKTYWGELHKDQDPSLSSTVFGFENISAENKSLSIARFDLKGTFWGYVQCGQAEFSTEGARWSVHEGQWFSLPVRGPSQLQVQPQSRVFLVYTSHHSGLSSMGGPVEGTGRLKYIDGCSDTLLYCPPMQGDPCLNLLHFPVNIMQTVHFHPSSRSGIVSVGKGLCHVDEHQEPLEPGMIFFIPKNLQHNFSTPPKNTLNVISFHPDSDWGPTHEVHPMINRTWTEDGKSSR